MPQDKSLFGSPPGLGLPIGNLTSHVFANFYLNEFDHFVKHALGVRYYGRYVDDLVLIDSDPERLKGHFPLIRSFLGHLGLDLHPKKISLQPAHHGVALLGVFIKPGRTYAGGRVVRQFHACIEAQNRVAEDHKPNREERQRFLSSFNSYLGILSHYRTYTLRKSAYIKRLSRQWQRRFRLNPTARKLVGEKPRFT